MEIITMTALDPLTTAAETGRGYPQARKAVVEYVQRIAAERDMLKKAMREVADDLADGEKLI
jgi:uncharacterized protein YdeI (YjbR/CyaY-like superfamily)